jgi:para-aminobenzoate synthetase/4-amino-4-deoxychorismate lyase
LAVAPIDIGDVFLYHKTSRRDVYDRARAGRPDADSVILWNTNGEVTEAAEANVVISVAGVKVTPPVSSGLLAGTLRAELLEAGEIEEGAVTVEEFRAAKEIWLINSVRGWIRAVRVD